VRAAGNQGVRCWFGSRKEEFSIVGVSWKGRRGLKAREIRSLRVQELEVGRSTLGVELKGQEEKLGRPGFIRCFVNCK